jgi:DNA modification methylase
VAQRLGRRFLGIDCVLQYCGMARQRLERQRGEKRTGA